MASDEGAGVSPPTSVSSRGNNEAQSRDEGSGGSNNGGGGPARRPPRKRRRTIISCTECHRRKQKCDRNLPCTNCVSRSKQDACRYETGAPTAKAVVVQQQQQEEEEGAPRGVSANNSNGCGAGAGLKVRVGGGGAKPGVIPAKMANLGYLPTGTSTLGFLKKLDGTNPEESLSSMAMGRGSNGEYFGIRERYKSLIRQLPARSYTQKLVDIYFKDFNWAYNVSES